METKEAKMNILWPVFNQAQEDCIKEIMSGSDRVAAIVGGAYLDQTLERTLRERLRQKEPDSETDVAQKLLKVGGPLGFMEPKINMLYLLYGVEKDVRNAMYAICKIRNGFAHNLEISSFDSDDPDIRGGFKNLILHKSHEFFPHHLLNRPSKTEIVELEHKREIFIVNLAICGCYLMRDRISHLTHTNLPLTEEEQLEKLKSGFPDGIPDA